jgi:uncharacterized protein YodC (DUF2158 family)
MADEKFQVGDRVKLKSGGPVMTYSGDTSTGEAICIWFDKAIKLTDTFPHAVLQRYQPPPLSGRAVRG